MREEEKDTRNFKKQIKLTLHTGEEHNLYINSNIFDASELMYPAFQAALASLREILHNAEKWVEENRENGQMDRLVSRPRQLYEYSNNILAFCAERGQGKTSAMLSFAEALHIHSWTDQKISGIEDAYFYIIPPIDPTVLTKEDNVVEIVLSRLYHEFNQLLKNGSGGSLALSAPEKGKLLSDFQECMYGLRTQGRRGGLADDFEALTQLSDCFEVKNLLQEILSQFFRISGKDPKTSYLVVPLDDTDLQFQCAYQTLEEVRKYLSLPNIIVLMATDLEQLRKLIIDHHLAVLDHAVRNKVISPSEIQRMTAKYLDKLIPASHAIYLPTVRIQYEANKEILLDCRKTAKKTADGKTEQETAVELQKKILTLICQKTGIILAQSSGRMHPLVPTTLRGLRQFYRFLVQMEACEEPEELKIDIALEENENIRRRETFCRQKLEWISKREQNLNLLESYLVNDWCSSKLFDKDWNLVKQIGRLSPSDGVSLAVEQICGNYYQKFVLSKDSNFLNLVNLLKQMEKKSAPETRYFACALQTYFSIQFQKLALKGWRDSIYQWAEGSTTLGLSFRFPELYDCIGGCLTMVRGKRIEKRIRYDLANCLTEILTVSTKGIPWQAEMLMIRVLNFVTAVCCSWDVQAEIRNYAGGEELQISDQDSFEGFVHKYYTGLEKNLRERFMLNEAGSLNGLTPTGTFASAFETGGPRELRTRLESLHRENAKAALVNLAAALESYDSKKTPDNKTPDAVEPFRVAEKALSLLEEDTSYGSISKNLKEKIAEIEEKIAMAQLTAEDKNLAVTELRKAAQAIR